MPAPQRSLDTKPPVFCMTGWVVLLWFLLFCGLPASAQLSSASISGLVHDPSGAVVPDAKVSTTGLDTGVVRTTTSNSTGVYVFTSINPGNYSVEASAPGCSSQKVAKITLTVGQVAAIDFALKVGSESTVGSAQSRSIPEEIEWTWEVRPPHANPKLPNVLLLGDSITRSYFARVTIDLAGVANVYLMSSSTSVGDPRLPHQIAEFAALEDVPFAVVHFNNGMHGWQYTEAQYRAAFPLFLKSIHGLPGHGRLIWATTTPVRADIDGGPTNERIDTRNDDAEVIVRPDNLRMDDLHALMSKHGDLHQDNVHFKDTGTALMGDQVAALIKQALPVLPFVGSPLNPPDQVPYPSSSTKGQQHRRADESGHSSQGQTAERVLIHVDTKLGAKDLLNNRMAYVSITRGAHDAQLFTNDREKVPKVLEHDVSHESVHTLQHKQEQSIQPPQ
jgi:hypothetical protein